MTDRREIWRRHLWWWLPAAIFVAVNLVFVFAYQLIYAEQVEGLGEELEAQELRLERTRAERQELEQVVRVAEANQEELRTLYVDRFASERRRFTSATAEVRDLARRAGLDPSAIQYPEEELEDFGLVKRSIAFRVEGSYGELRQFVNLLELTPSFITLEEVALSQGEGDRLAITLTLSTLFTDEEILGRIERGELDPVEAARLVRTRNEQARRSGR
jgi:Tfp pilus assembly protein PilO